jgi:hypothetical protein
MRLTFACQGGMFETSAAGASMVKSPRWRGQHKQVRQLKGVCGPGRIIIANGCASRCMYCERMLIATVLPG